MKVQKSPPTFFNSGVQLAELLFELFNPALVVLDALIQTEELALTKVHQQVHVVEQLLTCEQHNISKPVSTTRLND